MPGLADPEVIDLISLSPDGSTCRLHIVEVDAWSERPDAGQLNEKLLNYVGFALDGQLAAAYPEVVGLPIQIVIDAYFELTPDAVADLEAFKRGLGQYEIDLTWTDGLRLQNEETRSAVSERRLSHPSTEARSSASPLQRHGGPR